MAKLRLSANGSDEASDGGSNCLINGLATSKIDATARALHYGDGLFETIACRHGEPLHWPRHMQRLALGCDVLGFPTPDSTLLLTEARMLLASGSGLNAESAVMKIILSRNAVAGQRGYSSAPKATVSRVLQRSAWPEGLDMQREQGVTVRFCRHRLSQQPALTKIKHLNRLDQVIARSEWQATDIYEGLLLDQSGSVIEATAANVFAVINGRCITPDLTNAGHSGTMRQRILDWAQINNISIDVRPLSLDQINKAGEVFLSNAIVGILPVRELAGGRRYSVPGAFTTQLQIAFRNGEL